MQKSNLKIQTPLPSEPKLDRSTPCWHLRSVTYPSFEILAWLLFCAFISWYEIARLEFKFVGLHSSPKFKALDQGRILLIVEYETIQVHLLCMSNLLMTYNTSERRVTLIFYFYSLWHWTWHAIIACGGDDYLPGNPSKRQMAKDTLDLMKALVTWI